MMSKVVFLAILGTAAASVLEMEQGGKTTSLNFNGKTLNMGSAPVALGSIMNLEEAVIAAKSKDHGSCKLCDAVTKLYDQGEDIKDQIKPIMAKLVELAKKTTKADGSSAASAAASCNALFREGKTNGVFWVKPSSGKRQVYCDMGAGGGWTLAVRIRGNSERHAGSNAHFNHVGDHIVKPSSPVSKYSDAVINTMMSASESRASIRFECNGLGTKYLKGCKFDSWDAVSRHSSRNCIKLYNDERATSVFTDHNCNRGSIGLGNHCSRSHGSYGFNYCSHCDDTYGAYPYHCNSRGCKVADNHHNRRGCGHDNHGYARDGHVYVRM